MPKNKDAEYTWKDIICVKGKEIFAEEHAISGEMDGEGNDAYWQIDDFLEAAAKKHDCDIDDITTYMMDGEGFNGDAPFDVSELPFGIESCGAYIDGVGEWALDEDDD